MPIRTNSFVITSLKAQLRLQRFKGCRISENTGDCFAASRLLSPPTAARQSRVATRVSRKRNKASMRPHRHTRLAGKPNPDSPLARRLLLRSLAIGSPAGVSGAHLLVATAVVCFGLGVFVLDDANDNLAARQGTSDEEITFVGKGKWLARKLDRMRFVRYWTLSSSYFFSFKFCAVLLVRSVAGLKGDRWLWKAYIFYPSLCTRAVYA